MKKRNVILGAIASLGLGLASASWAAPTVTSEVLIFDGSSITNPFDPMNPYDGSAFDFGTPMVAGGDGKIALQPNTYYVVALKATVNTPNVTDSLSLRNSGTRAKQLGLQTAAFDIKSTGTANVFSAVPETSTIPPTWYGYYDNVGLGFGDPFVNLNNIDGDSDPDPNGGSFINTSTNLNSSGVLPNFQIGVGGTILYSGLFRTAATAGEGTLFAPVLSAAAYYDPTANSNTVAAEDALPGATVTPTAFKLLVGPTGPDAPEATALAKAGYAVLDIPVQGGNGQYVSPIVPGGPDKKVAIDLTQTVPGGVGPESDTLYVMLRLVGSQAAFDAWKTNAGIAPFINLTSGLEGQGAYAGIFGGQDANNHAVVLRFSTQTGPGAERFANIDLGADLSLGAAAAVPEPATLSLLALGAVGLLSRRRR